MPDTVRTLTALQALLADNTARDISEQDLRDGIYSVLGVVPYVAKTANYTATENDEYINVDATSGAVIITLPAAASTRVGKRLTVKKIDSSANAVIIDGNASETGDDETTLLLFTRYASVTIVNGGAAWVIESNNGLTNGAIFLATAGATVANTVTETTVIGSGIGTLTLPANFFRVGKTFRLTAMGFVSTTGTPTLNLRQKLGSTVITATGAVTTGSGLANALLSVSTLLTCRTVGASGTVIAAGQAGIGTVNAGLYPTSGTTVTIDTTASQAIGLTAEWGTASASNTLTVTNVAVERLN